MKSQLLYCENMKSLLAAIVLFLKVTIQYEILNEIPVTFQLAGNISYTPTSGGANIQGYILKVGFYSHSWIGVKFMSITSRSTYDVIVIKRQTSPVGGYYKTTVKDYFVSSARQDKLLADSNNNMDREVITYDQSNYFEAEIYRTKGNTQGQDWQGGQFTSVCFYTSGNTFNQNVWSGLIQSCYGYDVSIDYFSTLRGRYIGSMTVDAVSSSVYGGIEGPVLQLQLFWFVARTSLSSSDVFIRVGDKITDELGYDYYKCNSGDYFGHDTGSLTPDTLWSGYDDGYCQVSSSSAGTKISYTRNIYTDDQFDSKIYNETEICIKVGTNDACQSLKFQILFPVMTVDSALVVWEFRLAYFWVNLLLAILIFSH